MQAYGVLVHLSEIDDMSLDEAVTESSGGNSAWWRAGIVSGLVSLGVILLFWDTFQGMVSIWIRSETFAHGFLILPISLWLVWEKRREIALLTPYPNLWILLLTLPIGFGWILGHMVDVLVVQQFAAVALLIVCISAVLGLGATKGLLFPLMFLLFAVPVGEGLISPMMDFTADFTVTMLELTGIPVYREGNFFSIPSGNWSVVEACSGVRYLIASVTLGVLYAYLTYQKLWKRLVFISFSIVVPIIANGFRAYGIVMIGHLSGMTLAVGVDHLVYGWLWFGVVITFMFIVGAIWRDPHHHVGKASEIELAPHATLTKYVSVVVLSLGVIAAWPALAVWMDQAENHGPIKADVSIPEMIHDWRKLTNDRMEWRPKVVNADWEFDAAFETSDGKSAKLYMAVYLEQRQNAELVNSQNLIVDAESPWRLMSRSSVQVTLAGDDAQIDQALVSYPGVERVVVWHWYRIGNFTTSNAYMAKLLEAMTKLTGSRKDAAYMAVSASYDNSPEEVTPRLQKLINEVLPVVESSFLQVVEKR